MASAVHTTRRSLFAAAPALALVGFAVPTLAADTELSALAVQWDRTRATADQILLDLKAVEKRFWASPPKPPRLVFTAADQERSHLAEVGARWPWEEVKRIAVNAKSWRTDPDRYPTRLRWAARFERAVERHKSALQAWDAECGYTATNDTWDALLDDIADIERKMLALPCRSLADAQIMSRVAVANVDNDHGRDAGQKVADFVIRMGAH